MTIKTLRKYLGRLAALQNVDVRLMLYNDQKTVLYLKDLTEEDIVLRQDEDGTEYLGFDGDIPLEEVEA